MPEGYFYHQFWHIGVDKLEAGRTERKRTGIMQNKLDNASNNTFFPTLITYLSSITINDVVGVVVIMQMEAAAASFCFGGAFPVNRARHLHAAHDGT